MAIKNIRITNFKSFDDVSIGLNDVNVIVGANASGKSNFISALKFIRDMQLHSLDDAISIQGGVENFKNCKIKGTPYSYFEITSDEDTIVPVPIISIRPINEALQTKKIVYGIKIEYTKDGKKVKGKTEEIFFFGNLCQCRINADNCNNAYGAKIGVNDESPILTGFLHFIFRDGIIEFDAYKGGVGSTEPCPELRSLIDEDMMKVLKRRAKQIGLIRSLESMGITIHLEFPLTGIQVFDFDPKLLKRSISFSSKNKLEEDGSNLALVLKRILSDKKQKALLISTLNRTLPFVTIIDTEDMGDKTVLFKAQEKYYHDKKKEFYATFLSDGTINILALIVALYFQHSPLAIIEEPERNLHPAIIPKIAQMMKDVTSVQKAEDNKQIIVTTHNPEFIKSIELNDLILIYRDDNGFTKLVRPSTLEYVQQFLDEGMSLEEIFVANKFGI